MTDTEKTALTLLDDPRPATAREVTAALRRVAETFAEVPDRRDTAQSARDEAFTLVRSVAQWLLR